MGDGTVPVMSDLHVSERRRCSRLCPRGPKGGIRGGETRDTKPFSDLVFRDSALKYPQPTIKKFRTAYEMLQVARSGAEACTTAAA